MNPSPPETSASLRIESRHHQGLAYRRYFSDPERDWVLLIPGAGAAATIWRRQISLLHQSYNLIAVDPPGHGRSHNGHRDESYSFESIATRLVGLLDHEQIPSAHLLGMSLGGIVAEAIALHNPQRVRSMVLAGGVARLTWFTRSAMFLGWALSAFTPYMLLYNFFSWIIMPGPSHAATRRAFARQATRVGRSEFLRWYNLCPDALPLFQRLAQRPSQIPTLFVMGAQDRLFRPCALERSRQRSDSSVVTIPHCGHVCSVENPVEFNRQLAAFLCLHSQHSA